MAGAVITTGNHPKAMWPGIKAWWSSGKEQPPLWPDMVEQATSDKAYEELVEDVGFNLISVKPQTEAITYQADSQGPTTRATHVPYAGGYMVSYEEMRDNLYAEVAQRRTKKLSRAARATHETVVADMYNNGFDTNYTGGDGVCWFSASHPCNTGNQSNLLTAADVSEAAIEDAVTAIMNMTDSVGLKEDLHAESIHYAPANWAEVTRILKSVLQNDTAQNAVNAIKLTGQFPKGQKQNPYITDTDSWFIRTDALNGAMHFQRDELSFSEDGAFDSKVQKYACYERYSVKWANWRSAVGNRGA